MPAGEATSISLTLQLSTSWSGLVASEINACLFVWCDIYATFVKEQWEILSTEKHILKAQKFIFWKEDITEKSLI